MANVVLGDKTFSGVSAVKLKTASGGAILFEPLNDDTQVVDDCALWAYLSQSTLYLNRADSFVQNGNILEVQYV